MRRVWCSPLYFLLFLFLLRVCAAWQPCDPGDGFDLSWGASCDPLLAAVRLLLALRTCARCHNYLRRRTAGSRLILSVLVMRKSPSPLRTCSPRPAFRFTGWLLSPVRAFRQFSDQTLVNINQFEYLEKEFKLTSDILLFFAMPYAP